MTTPSTATLSTKNFIYERSPGSVTCTQVYKEQPSSQWVWYSVTDGRLAPLGCEYGYRYDAAYLQFIQTLIHSHREAGQTVENYLVDDEPFVYFSPTNVDVFEMEVTEIHAGRIEATFTLDDLEYLIDE